MSNTQTILSLLALLPIDAVAAAVDEQTEPSDLRLVARVDSAACAHAASLQAR